jgi:hypothetical protein
MELERSARTLLRSALGEAPAGTSEPGAGLLPWMGTSMATEEPSTAIFWIAAIVISILAMGIAFYLEDPCMASVAYCRNRSASLMTASRVETPRRRLPSFQPWASWNQQTVSKCSLLSH